MSLKDDLTKLKYDDNGHPVLFHESGELKNFQSIDVNYGRELGKEMAEVTVTMRVILSNKK